MIEPHRNARGQGPPIHALNWVVGILAIASWVLFGEFLANSIERAALLNTIGLGAGTVIVSAVIGSLLSGLLGSESFASRLALTITFVAASWPIYWHLAAWDAALGQLGWWSAFSDSPWHATAPRWLAAIWVHGLAAAPWYALLTGLFRIENGRVADEQGLLDGDAWSVFWKITFPREWPVHLLASSWIFLTTTREIAVVDIYQIGTIAEQVYLGFALGQFDQMLRIWPEGQTAISFRLYLLTVIVLCLIAWPLFRCLRDWRLPGEVWTAKNSPSGIALGPIGRSLSWTALGLVALVPLLNLMIRSGLRVEATAAGPVREWSLTSLASAGVQGLRASQDELAWSLSIGLSVAVALFVAGALGVSLSERHRIWKEMYFLSLIIPLALPGPMIGALVGYGWSGLETPWAWKLADRTILLPVMASFFYCWPLAGASFWLVAGTLPRDQVEAAGLQGVVGWRQFWALQFAGRKRFFCGLGVMFLIIAWGELSAQQMVAAAGIDTIPRLLLGWLHSGVDEMAAATSLILGWVWALLAVAGLSWLGFPARSFTKSR